MLRRRFAFQSYEQAFVARNHAVEVSINRDACHGPFDLTRDVVVAHEFFKRLGTVFLEESAWDVLRGEERKSEELADFKTLMEQLCPKSSAVGLPANQFDNFGNCALCRSCFADTKQDSLSGIAGE